jgi:hypothetical protein
MTEEQVVELIELRNGSDCVPEWRVRLLCLTVSDYSLAWNNSFQRPDVCVRDYSLHYMKGIIGDSP